jgi:hypothetical protein
MPCRHVRGARAFVCHSDRSWNNGVRVEDTVLEDEPGLDGSDDDVQLNGRRVICYEGKYMCALRHKGHTEL